MKTIDWIYSIEDGILRVPPSIGVINRMRKGATLALWWYRSRALTKGVNTVHQSGIYVLKNTITGACYIGQSSRLAIRKASHFNMLGQGKHHSIYLQRSFNEHGQAAFEWSVLEEVPPDRTLLFQREAYWIETLQPEYNSAIASVSRFGTHYTEKGLAAIRAAQANPETKRRHSEAGKGKKRTPEQCETMRKAQKGHKVSEATRLKYSQAQKGKQYTEELRQIRREHVHSEEAKQKIASKAQLRWSSPEWNNEAYRKAHAAKVKEGIRLRREASGG